MVLTTCASLVRLNLASCRHLQESSLQSLAVPTAGDSLEGDDVAVRLVSSLLPEATPFFVALGEAAGGKRS